MFLNRQRRLALVVGNADYAHAAALKNPVNDARAIGERLQQLGFEVYGGTRENSEPDGPPNVGENLDKVTMLERFETFVKRISPGDHVFLFFAGHGIQVDSENYIIPTDASLHGSHPLNELVSIRRMIEFVANKVERRGKTIVFLDACREDPFSPDQIRALAENARSLNPGRPQDEPYAAVNKGFSTMKMRPGENASPTFIAFATAPGDFAYDGAGNNSPFTTSILQHVETRGLPLEKFMERVSLDVLDQAEQSGKYQEPWYESSLRSDFYFNPTSFRPILEMTGLGFLVGALVCWLLFDRNTIIPPANGSWLIYASGIPFALLPAFGVWRWGSAHPFKIVVAFVAAMLSFALALMILQTPVLHAPAQGPDTIGKALNELSDSSRLVEFLSKPRLVATSVLVLLAGIVLAAGTALGLATQQGAWRGFGALTGAIAIGLLMPVLYVVASWANSAYLGADIYALLLAVGTEWFALLGFQIGYCFMYHVPEHKRLRKA